MSRRDAASEQAHTQSEVAKYQTKVSENEALSAVYASQVEASNRREMYRRQMAAQRARIGASGVTSDEGSPLLVQMDAAEQATLDLERVKYAGDTRAALPISQARISGYLGRQAITAGQLRAGTSLLSGLSDAYKAWPQRRDDGTGGGTGDSVYIQQ